LHIGQQAVLRDGWQRRCMRTEVTKLSPNRQLFGQQKFHQESSAKVRKGRLLGDGARVVGIVAADTGRGGGGRKFGARRGLFGSHDGDVRQVRCWLVLVAARVGASPTGSATGPFPSSYAAYRDTASGGQLTASFGRRGFNSDRPQRQCGHSADRSLFIRSNSPAKCRCRKQDSNL
jgi:hypothetical protein